MKPVTLMRTAGVVVFAVVCAGLLLAQTTVKNQTTYTDLFNPFGVPNPLVPTQVGQFLETPKVICPGNSPTGDPMQVCPAGSRVVARGARSLNRFESADAAMAGWATLELNANLAVDYAGPVWGKVTVQLDAGGTWEGTWNGIREFVPGSLPVWTVDLHVVMHGTGGDIDGMQAKCTELITALAPMPILYKGVATCRVLNPSEQ